MWRCVAAALPLMGLLAVVVAGPAACGGRAVGYDPDSGSYSVPSDGAPLRDVGPDADPLPTEIPCSEEGTWVYVISRDHGFYRFDPPLRQFHLISTLDCPTAGVPFSMAVSRSNIAYVLYHEPGAVEACVALNAVDVVTGECLGPTGFDCANPHGFNLFGMGYATLGPDTTQEELYIMRGREGDPWLASLEPEDGTLIPRVAIDHDYLGEMTGNSQGELFGFFNEFPAKVGRIDVSTGLLHDVVELGVDVNVGASAVAYWGGSFYVFASSFGSGDVFRVTGNTTTFHMSLSFSVVGAGVSTCAPNQQPDDADRGVW